MESTRTWIEVAISYSQFQYQMKASFEQKAKGHFPARYAAKRSASQHHKIVDDGTLRRDFIYAKKDIK